MYRQLMILAFFVQGCLVKGENEDTAKVVMPAKAALREVVVNDSGAAEKVRVEYLQGLLEQISGDSAIFKEAVGIIEAPLSDPNSPYRNEALYETILEAQLASPWHIDPEKAAYGTKLKLIRQNRPGSVANDFVLRKPDGSTIQMHSIAAERLLLFFYNPECTACKLTKERLAASPIIAAATRKQQLQVLAIYPDQDEALWRRHLKDFPPGWLHGRDVDEYIFKHGVYDLRAIPTMYLLDKEKKVLLKDAVEVGEVERGVSGF